MTQLRLGPWGSAVCGAHISSVCAAYLPRPSAMPSPVPARGHRSRSVALPFASALLLVLALAFVSSTLHAAPEPADAAPRMLGDAQLVSGNGAVLLHWAPADHDHDHDHEYELQESRAADFAQPSSRYRGQPPSYFASGRLDGRSYFRVRSRAQAADGRVGPWSEWSAAQSVRVEHHDLRLALGLFILGLVVFVATVIAVLLGARSSNTPR